MKRDIYWIRIKPDQDSLKAEMKDPHVDVYCGNEFISGRSWFDRLRNIRTQRCQKFVIYCGDLETLRGKRRLSLMSLIVPADSRYLMDVHDKSERILPHWVLLVGLPMLIFEIVAGLLLIAFSSLLTLALLVWVKYR